MQKAIVYFLRTVVKGVAYKNSLILVLERPKSFFCRQTNLNTLIGARLCTISYSFLEVGTIVVVHFEELKVANETIAKPRTYSISS